MWYLMTACASDVQVSQFVEYKERREVMHLMFHRAVPLILAALSFATASATVGAQANRYATDLPGAGDHPLISRYAGSTLYLHGGENYGKAKVFVAGKQGVEIEEIEGKLTNRLYWAPAQRSPIEVFRNYQQALRQAGFEVLYECEEARCKQDRTQNQMVRWVENMRWIPSAGSQGYLRRMFEYKPGFHYLHARKRDKDASVDVQVALRAGDSDRNNAGRVQQLVQVIESARVEGGKVMVDAAAIRSSLRREGRVALYGVLFDTNQAVIKPESGATLGEMAGALKADAALDVFIVGHTDNQGAVAGNVDLSRRRAQAVVDALVSRHGIAANRLQAQGVANFAPAAVNTSEDGRAKNRRVEMVVR